MSRFLLTGLFLFTLIAGALPAQEMHQSISDPIDKQHYVTLITEEMVKKTPVWKADAENPPVSARKAIALADKYVAQKFKPDPKVAPKWEQDFESISLVAHGDHWFWHVHYEWYPTQGEPGENVPHAYVVVLMDGTVVPLQIEKAQPTNAKPAVPVQQAAKPAGPVKK